MRQRQELQSILYRDIVWNGLLEDLGRGGDVTTDAVVGDASFSGVIVAREVGRVAGLGPAAAAFTLLDGAVEVRRTADDGAMVGPGDVLLELDGPARAVLSAERTALNFLGRLSGIATLTSAYVEAVRGTGAAVVCTRKTTPGLRILEKYAVRCGGGSNHRFGLDDAVLIKDNHLAVAGSVAEAVARVRRSVGHTVKIEVEVDTLEQLEEAVAQGVDIVLLDNMGPRLLRQAVALVDGRVLTEASGGITLETAAEVAGAGVDLLSVGALTHSAVNFDVGLDAR